MLKSMPIRLFTPTEGLSAWGFINRIALVCGLFLAVTIVVYYEKGLIDTHTGTHPDFWSCLYFSIITITTVGYGDIVPTGSSRLVDALLLTPVRFVVIYTLFDTAYELALRRFRETYKMKRATRKLKSHILICGYGATGHSVLDELLLQGISPEQIVVIDTREAALEEASEKGVLCVVGDAAREHLLKSLQIQDAAHVLVCPGRDDTAVLICLTVVALNPNAQVVAMCHEAENVKLLERSGAHQIVNPSHAGGNLMAAATRKSYLVDTMKDILSFGGILRLKQRNVLPGEVGLNPKELPGISVVRIYRNEGPIEVNAFSPLESGDTLVYIDVVQDAMSDES